MIGWIYFAVKLLYKCFVFVIAIKQYCSIDIIKNMFINFNLVMISENCSKM